MKNPFANIDTKISKIKSQQKDGNEIIIKKRGRPIRPNMVKKLIKVDEVLYQEIANQAIVENTTIASIIGRALRNELRII